MIPKITLQYLKKNKQNKKKQTEEVFDTISMHTVLSFCTFGQKQTEN